MNWLRNPVYGIGHRRQHEDTIKICINSVWPEVGYCVVTLILERLLFSYGIKGRSHCRLPRNIQKMILRPLIDYHGPEGSEMWRIKHGQRQHSHSLRFEPMLAQQVPRVQSPFAMRHEVYPGCAKF